MKDGASVYLFYSSLNTFTNHLTALQSSLLQLCHCCHNWVTIITIMSQSCHFCNCVIIITIVLFSQPCHRFRNRVVVFAIVSSLSQSHLRFCNCIIAFAITLSFSQSCHPSCNRVIDTMMLSLYTIMLPFLH